MSEFNIDQILSTIKSTEIRNIADIEKERKEKLYYFFQEYLGIEANVSNFKKSLIDLKDYEYIDIDETSNGDYVRYINDRYFYDIELKPGGFVVGRQGDKLILKSDVSLFKVRSKLFFRKINDERKAKMMLLEMINKENINF